MGAHASFGLSRSLDSTQAQNERLPQLFILYIYRSPKQTATTNMHLTVSEKPFEDFYMLHNPKQFSIVIYREKFIERSLYG